MDRDPHDELALYRMLIARGLSVIFAIVLGVGAGFVLIIFFWFGMAAIGQLLLLLLLPFGVTNVSTGPSILLILGVYTIWFAVWLFVFLAMKRAAGTVNFVLLFFFVFIVVLPLPSIYGAIYMMTNQ